MVGVILVTGGTGTLGRLVVARLAEAGVPVRVLSRRVRTRGSGTTAAAEYVVGDLAEGTGLGPALHGVGAIVHCASDPRAAGRDVRAAGNLIEAAKALATARPATIIYISIVGIDGHPLRYYRDKLAVERLIAGCGLPWTILRTTQFHDLVAMVAGLAARSPLVPALARTSIQPIDASEVAERLVELVGQPGQGRVSDMGGPQVRTFADLVRTYLRAVGKRRPVVPVWLPGAVGRAFRAGHHLAAAQATGRITFEEYLARRS
jgi:uncharacterized protein YbjT (DUF2867 family)